MTDLVNIATIASAFSTVVIALLTAFLLLENYLLRKSGSEPMLVAYFEPHPDGTGGLNIALANVGSGPAKDVYFNLKGDQEIFSQYDLVLDCTKQRGPMTLIPQDDKVSFLFAVGYQLFNPKNSNTQEAFPPFVVEVKWSKLKSSKVISREYTLDVKPYADLPGYMNKPYLLKIADSVDGLNKSVRVLKNEVSAVKSVISTNKIKDTHSSSVVGNEERVQS